MEKILQYQKIDSEIQKLIRESNNSEEKVVMNKMIAYVKDAQNKSNVLESKGSQLLDEYKALKAKYEGIAKKVTKLTAQTEIADYKNTFSEINTLSSELFMIERNLNIVITKAKELLKEFENTKNNVLKARAKHKESKDKYEQKLNEINPKIEALKKQKASMEKDIQPKFLEKYKAVRNDNIFPVFVPLNGNTCMGCRMELPSSKLNKLSTEQYIICEHCGRVIYNK